MKLNWPFIIMWIVCTALVAISPGAASTVLAVVFGVIAFALVGLFVTWVFTKKQ